MTQEDKKLLLKDLSSRLPYGVKLLCNGWDSDGGCEFSTVETLIGIDDRFIHTLWRNEKDKHSIEEPLSILDYKPYLRSMDSMTEEEFESLKEYSGLKYDQLDLASFQNGAYKCLDFYLSEVPSYVVILVFDWLNKNHFDYRGFIERGLAIKVTKENNPYEN